jgi:hypothetical protein
MDIPCAPSHITYICGYSIVINPTRMHKATLYTLTVLNCQRHCHTLLKLSSFTLCYCCHSILLLSCSALPPFDLTWAVCLARAIDHPNNYILYQNEQLMSARRVLPLAQIITDINSCPNNFNLRNMSGSWSPPPNNFLLLHHIDTCRCVVKLCWCYSVSSVKSVAQRRWQ